MPRKLRELRADLRKVGWRKMRQRGSHETWQHPLLPGQTVILAGKDGDDADRYQERDVKNAVHRADEAKRRQ